MNKKLKISATAYRVLLILLHLNNRTCSAECLNDIFLKDPYISRYFSKDVILKYIITLRTAGYNIAKPTFSNNYNYELNKSPVLVELNFGQIKNLAALSRYAKCMYRKKIINNYDGFLKKIKKYLPESQVEFLNKEQEKQCKKTDDIRLKKESLKDLINKIEEFLEEDRKVSVKYKLYETDEEKQLILELKNIKYEKNETYITGYSTLTEQMHAIKPEQIIEIKQLPSKSQYKQILSPVIFKLKGPLAKIYRPYENEKIVTDKDKTNTVTVTSYVDDHNMSIKRLLRYGENCEILYPKHTKTEMIKIIGKTLANYGETAG